MKKGKEIFWGVLFLLGAVALIVGKLGYLGEINFWSVLISIGLIGFLTEGIFKRDFGMILFAIAFLAIVNDKALGIEAITPWPVIGAATLGTIGLNMLFPKKKEWNHHVHQNRQMENEEIITENGESVSYTVSFGEAVKYVPAQEIKEVDASCSFGNLEIYFSDAILKDHHAYLNAKCSFGCIVLYIPSEWTVQCDVNPAFGGVNESGHCRADGENILEITGSACFSALEIKYI